jgi:competence protein ComEA
MSVRLGLNILLMVGIVATIAGGAVLLFRDSGSEDSITITLDEPESVATPAMYAEVPTMIKVYVSGAARRPGVYELPADARLDDALQAAGGPTSDAALEVINLAKRLADEDHIHIPGQADTEVRRMQNEASLPIASGGLSEQGGPGRLNINTATVEDLTTLPNIGPSRAAAIVDYREREGLFSSVDDLMNVGGIGEKITDSIRDLVVVR